MRGDSECHHKYSRYTVQITTSAYFMWHAGTLDETEREKRLLGGTGVLKDICGCFCFRCCCYVCFCYFRVIFLFLFLLSLLFRSLFLIFMFLFCFCVVLVQSRLVDPVLFLSLLPVLLHSYVFEVLYRLKVTI